MILQCPACETRFLVDASVIPAGGREVKCARCAHLWFVKPEEPAGEDAVPVEVVESAVEVSDSPTGEDIVPTITFGEGDTHKVEEYDIPLSPHVAAAATITQKASVAPLLTLAAMLLIAFIVLSLVVFRDMLQPVLAPVYSAIGMERTDGLALADVTFRERMSKSKARFVVEGKILNESDEIRTVPLLRVALADANGEWVLSREYEAEGDQLQPGESYTFKATNLETTFVDRIDHVVVEIGSTTELMLRK